MPHQGKPELASSDLAMLDSLSAKPADAFPSWRSAYGLVPPLPLGVGQVPGPPRQLVIGESRQDLRQVLGSVRGHRQVVGRATFGDKKRLGLVVLVRLGHASSSWRSSWPGPGQTMRLNCPTPSPASQPWGRRCTW